jgi:hypothetical protein
MDLMNIQVGKPQTPFRALEIRYPVVRSHLKRAIEMLYLFSSTCLEAGMGDQPCKYVVKLDQCASSVCWFAIQSIDICNLYCMLFLGTSIPSCVSRPWTACFDSGTGVLRHIVVGAERLEIQ